jgi:hypothetical protein
MHVMVYAILVIASCALKHLMHCTILLLAHIRSYTLDHTNPMEPTEQAQVEEFTNFALDQDKTCCI